MTPSRALLGVLRIVLLFVSLVGSAGWGVYWFMFRLPETDFRVFAVGLLLATVMGWWPWVAAGGTLVASVGVLVALAPPELRLQYAGEVWVFGLLGLGWGTLARLQFHPPAHRPRSVAPRVAPSSTGAFATPAKKAEPEPFRSKRLTEAADEVARTREPYEPPPMTHSRPPDVNLGWTPNLAPPAEPPPPPEPAQVPPLPSHQGILPVPPPVAPFPSGLSSIPLARPQVPPPRPSGPPSLAEYGGESVYLGSLPDMSKGGSAHPESSHPPASGFPPPPPPLAVPRFQEEPSVVPAMEFPTMELPINTLLRPQAQPNSTWAPSSSEGPGSQAGPGSSAGDTGSDSQGLRRTAAFQRPETDIGSSWEKILEWYNQFSWSPWSAAELERKYHRPGVHVGWESLALQDIVATWKVWRNGCVPPALEPGQIELKSLEGFLRCEVLGILRHQGFPDLHTLSRGDGSEGWLAVYSEVRGRMRGGEAKIQNVESGPPLVDRDLGLVGRPDRLAEIRGESDVVALVTPFAVREGLSWSGVYAMAQYQLAHGLGIALSSTPVVVNLPLPVWDERKQSRLITVEDLISERRRLEVALERFRRILEGQTPPRPQTQASTCSGCGARHFCPNYLGTRPRLDLANPPPQLAVALR